MIKEKDKVFIPFSFKNGMEVGGIGIVDKVLSNGIVCNEGFYPFEVTLIDESGKSIKRKIKKYETDKE